MKEKKFCDAYDEISLDSQAKADLKKRILCSQHSWEKNSGGLYYMKKKIAVACLTLFVMVAISGSAYAAYRWYQASEAATLLGDDKLAAAFGKTEQEIQVTTSGNYRIVSLGTVTGKNISDQILENDNPSETYAAVAIERLDGKPMDYDSGLVASPLIQGLDPKTYNIYSMGGGSTSKVVNGVLYLIASCKDIGIFADRTIYLAVTEGPEYQQAFDYQKSTGLIKTASNYKGVQALFELSMDASLADPGAVQTYLANFNQDKESDTSNKEGGEDLTSQLSQVLITNTSSNPNVIDAVRSIGDCFFTKALTPAADGSISFSYNDPVYGGSEGMQIPTFSNGVTDMITSLSGSDETVSVEICTRNQDGTITVTVYGFTEEAAHELMKELQ